MEYKSQVVSSNLIQEADDFVVTDAYESSISGVTHIYFSQQLNGLEVIGTESSIHMGKAGDVVFSNENFIRFSSEVNIPSEIPKKSSIKGVEEALKALNYSANGNFSEVRNTKESYFFLTSAAYSFADIRTQLKYLRTQNNTLTLCWMYLLQDLATDESWTVLVDAHEGGILKIASWTQECVMNPKISPEASSFSIYPLPEKESVIAESLNCSNCYEVFPLPFESPYDGARQIVISPAHPVASPEGWHGTYGQTGAEDFTTTGNNTWAFDANDNYGYQPDGGEDLNFTGYDWSANYTNSNQYEDASITNMFYWINIAHDVLYQYGFNENAGNFQVKNFSQFGLEEDPIIAKAQTSTDECNASFGVGPDGERTVMTMNICGNKDGNFDNTVILHEFGHGIYGRLTGGPGSTYCLYNDERTTEGVADWYAIMLTMQAGDTEARSRQIAKYFFDQGIDGEGVRNLPYSTDMAINSYTYNSIKTAAVPHGVGEVWATILWELSWELINAHGYSADIYNFTGDFNQDAGNVMALGIVTEAMKLQPCTPGFVTARDAIIAADVILYDGQNYCYLWAAFAKRGLGANASQGSPENIGDGTESFDVPSLYANFNKDFDYCYYELVLDNLGGGLPYGGIYSGPGITDNGNGVSFTLDIIDAGVGSHTINYVIEDGDCSIASSAETSLDISIDIEPPSLTCVEDYYVVIQKDTQFSVGDYTFIANYSDNCDSIINLSQTPEAGTPLDVGDYTIQLVVEDNSGNTNQCEFMLYVREVTDEELEEAFKTLNLLPNPTFGNLVLDNSMGLKVERIRFYDVNGRLLKTNTLDAKEQFVSLSIEQFARGTYFAIIDTNADFVVKQIIKI